MNKARNAIDEYEQGRIPGSVFFDIDKVSDTSSPLPHMLPSEEVFAESVSSKGISSNDHVFVYVTKECFSAPRVWWMFRVFGHKKVSVIDGGLEAWVCMNCIVLNNIKLHFNNNKKKSIGGPLESGTSTSTSSGQFKAKLNKNMVSNWV